ncbi:hypothetical protein TraAM80_08580 [Trypanosoma rangeli]|uniref:PUB domain-containing protein n=1 Tax=Trypanosoma rangeli TaxID=5698 RepID=A0A422N012_TRYRA|nr:uncharacterized protein TraAM80_08580 [Trypanosoma rangeli]RNE98730.1 hypothetical protein TraAM80_08580 [Trypanosoma rangeli]|eukprot:RNE98730.1 hypothetical protein TraAM80_08580 [Trypanosoma rangeli]
MASLSEEIRRLSELFSNGVLSEEEFRAAKEATIKNYASLATAAPQVGKEGEEGQGAEAHARFLRVNISGFSDDFAGQAQRNKAYTLLEAILRNLLQFPEEERYRRLRLSNAALRSQLFPVPGVMGFLQSIGFARRSPDGGEGGDCLQLPEAPSRPLLDEGLGAIAFLRLRDGEAVARNKDCARLRRSLGLEVRRERWEKAKAVGELRSHIEREFCCDDCGDGLYSSQASLEKLETILTNALRYPAEAKYRRLRLSNPAVCAAVLRQRGGLEVLVGCAGGVVEEEEGESFLLLREGAATEGKLRCALQAVEGARAAVREAQREAGRRTREEAMEEVRREARRELRQCCPPPAPEGPGVGARAPGEARRGRRIPVAEALRHLMGQRGAEEDEE